MGSAPAKYTRQTIAMMTDDMADRIAASAKAHRESKSARIRALVERGFLGEEQDAWKLPAVEPFARAEELAAVAALPAPFGDPDALPVFIGAPVDADPFAIPEPYQLADEPLEATVDAAIDRAMGPVRQGLAKVLRRA